MEKGILDDITFEDIENAFMQEHKEMNSDLNASLCLFGGKNTNKLCNCACNYYKTCTRRIDEVDDFEDEDSPIVERDESDNIFGGKIPSQVGTLRKLISLKDYELPFRVMRLGDSSRTYELQTIRNNAVYAEIFEGGKSVDYCRFSINEMQRFMIVEG